MVYEHTQRSPLWLVVAPPILVVVAIVAVSSDAERVATAVAGAVGLSVLAIIAHFSVLTIRVEGSQVRAAFGRGWPRKTVDLDSIVAARRVRNRWIYGYGIRWIPKGSLWNVWGLDAVEFVRDSGRVTRFGTDDPDGLLAAVMPRVGDGDG